MFGAHGRVQIPSAPGCNLAFRLCWMSGGSQPISSSRPTTTSTSAFCSFRDAAGLGARQAQRRDDDRGSRVDRARGRGRPDHGRVGRERLPGSALRRGEAELHPEAAEGRRAGRRRPRTGDRLAAAAHPAEPQREDPAGRRGLSRRVDARDDSGDPAGQVTRAMGDVHPQGNPHYWLDPENGKADREGRSPTSSRSCGRTAAPPSSSGWPISRRGSTRA